ncbi:transducer of ERBB2 [Mortierella polycephala]|uniref:Phosphatidylglycerol/phosphatidylinositol transfer protein n=1 Tax=Mortierella polycephala TaxID=41804 RepID=A0A9P6QAN2_9FUNG|nr:transducer of ERBB2 [Mortierella polycephala]
MSLVMILLLIFAFIPTSTTAWPYVDCSEASPVFDLGTVTANFDPTNKVVQLAMEGNFTAASHPQGYTAQATSQWRTSIVTTIMGSQLHRSEGPACSMIAGGCPTAPGPATISTNFTIAQTAPFAELVISFQIMGANSQSIVCVAVLLEQNMVQVNTAVSYIPLALALYSGTISLISIMMRASVGNGFLSALATYGLASTSEVINVHTPGLVDIIFYTQFMVMTGQLSVNYPAFYSTFTSLFHWSFLEFRNSFAGNGPDNSTFVLMYGGAGSVNQVRALPHSSNSNLNKRLLPYSWDIEYVATSVTPAKTLPAARTTPPPAPTIIPDRERRKRQIQPAPNQETPPLSPSPPSPTATTSSETTNTISLESPSISTSSSTTTTSSSRSSSTTASPDNSSDTSKPTTTTSQVLIIPTIRDPFNQKNGVSKQYNVSRYGMEAYAAAIGAYPSNLFLCTLINTVMAGGASLFLSAIVLIIAWFIAKESHQKGKTLQHAFNFVAVRFLWGLSVAMLSSYGIAQVAVLMTVELGYILVIGIKWPYTESSDNKFQLALGIVRIMVTGCSIAYVHDLETTPEVRQLFGYIQMALHLSVYIVMFALVLWNTIQAVMFWRSRRLSKWKGLTNTYGFESPKGTEPDWSHTSRPMSHRVESTMLDPSKTRRYTVQPYSSMNDLRPIPGDKTFRHQSHYRQSLQSPDYRRSRFPSDDDHNMIMDLRPEAIIPLSSSAGPMSARSTSPRSHSPGASVESIDGPIIPLQQTQFSKVQFQPKRESYAKIQRMSHQQAAPDFRSRRMSEIFRDGQYLYESTDNLASPPSPTVQGEKRSVWTIMKGSLGGLFSRGKRSVKATVGDSGAKTKGFEVMRRPRPAPVVDTADDSLHIGDDNPRELNSARINRFFQESGLNNERNRSLFVANPEAMASQAGSFRSSISGIPLAPGKLNRTASVATSVYTLGMRSTLAQSGSAEMSTTLSGVESGQGTAESRRVSILSAQQHVGFPRNSVESSIAEALMTDTPLVLQGGGILKVSKGPEKAVQYWRKESGQYVESASTDVPAPEQKPQSTTTIAPPTPLLLLPTTRGALFDTLQVDTAATAAGSKQAPSVKSRAGSRPESPTESYHSTNNVAASAGRMHEILDRMFSDQDDDDDSDALSDGEESCSTFSGRVSATILALHQKREQEEMEFADSQSLYRPDSTLEPVLEHLDNEIPVVEVPGGIDINAKRTASTSSRPRPTRTISGPTRSSSSSSGTLLLRPSKSGSLARPLAQTPLHSPSVLPFSGSTTSLHLHGGLSRQSSYTSLSNLSSSIQSHPPVIIQEHDALEVSKLHSDSSVAIEESAQVVVEGHVENATATKADRPNTIIDDFKKETAALMQEKYTNHWDPQRPHYGNGYRAITSFGGKVDPLLCKAAQKSALPMETLQIVIPKDLVLWVEPFTVSFRVGDYGSINTIYDSSRGKITMKPDTASFQPKILSRPSYAARISPPPSPPNQSARVSHAIPITSPLTKSQVIITPRATPSPPASKISMALA